MPRPYFYRHLDPNYFRTAVFGLEDALVSTTGMVVGIAAGTPDRRFILLAGLVTVAVEALSMAAGQYISERTLHEMPGKKQHHDSLILGSLIMFVSYILAGMVPIIPLTLFTGNQALIFSLGFALVGLFILGFAKATITGAKPTRSALEVLFLGGAAASIGAAVGYSLRF